MDKYVFTGQITAILDQMKPQRVNKFTRKMPPSIPGQSVFAPLCEYKQRK